MPAQRHQGGDRTALIYAGADDCLTAGASKSRATVWRRSAQRGGRRRRAGALPGGWLASQMDETRLRRGDGSMLVFRRERAAVRAAPPGPARRCLPSAGPRQERFELRDEPRALAPRLLSRDLRSIANTMKGTVKNQRSLVPTTTQSPLKRLEQPPPPARTRWHRPCAPRWRPRRC